MASDQLLFSGHHIDAPQPPCLPVDFDMVPQTPDESSSRTATGTRIIASDLRPSFRLRPQGAFQAFRRRETVSSPSIPRTSHITEQIPPPPEIIPRDQPNRDHEFISAFSRVGPSNNNAQDLDMDVIQKLGLPEDLDDPRISARTRPKLQFRPSKKACLDWEFSLCNAD